MVSLSANCSTLCSPNLLATLANGGRGINVGGNHFLFPLAGIHLISDKRASLVLPLKLYIRVAFPLSESEATLTRYIPFRFLFGIDLVPKGIYKRSNFWCFIVLMLLLLPQKQWKTTSWMILNLVQYWLKHNQKQQWRKSASFKNSTLNWKVWSEPILCGSTYWKGWVGFWYIPVSPQAL